MPPAIPDSDDDSDELEGLECEDTVASSRGSRLNAKEGASNGLDGTDDRSTGSTELLRRQIYSAERGLLSNSAPVADQQHSSASPARQAAKRRHTAVFASEDNAGHQQGVKRAKTLKTYGGSRRQLEPADNDDFDRLHNDRDLATHTSQPARFSEHSGQHLSMPLPNGTLEADFQNHEPAVMFKDSGDTLADASSEQRRMFEDVIANKKGPSTSLTKEAQADPDQQSSSIPWTASDLAESAKSKKSHQSTQLNEKPTLGDDDSGMPQVPETSANGGEAAPAENRDAVGEAAALHETAKQDEFSLRRPKSSPMVEIPRTASRKASGDKEGPKSSRRDANSRKQKAQEESSEPLNSDDRAIGLPKERYKPRPSRRRATQVVEDPIDYAVIPEKAAKAKRTKTSGAKTTVTFDQQRVGASHDALPELASLVTSEDPNDQTALQKGLPQGDKRAEKQESEAFVSPVKPRRSIEQDDIVKPDTQPQKKDESASPVKSKSSEHVDEDKIFVKPALPTPKPKSSSKSKRAQTTIFEDHVEFMGSRQSPSLSQQQAKRKSALLEVQNEAVPKPGRKRKGVVADESDDEDELAKEDDAVASKAKSPPNKRRGRPPKAETAAKSKASKVMDEESDEDVEANDEPEAEEPDEDDEPPKKRGRGRPPKAASKPKISNDGEMVKETQPQGDSEKPADEHPDTALPATQKETTPSKGATPAAEIPTPSPEQQTEKTSATPQKAASSKPQHSPIKSSSKVPYRVGLSKKSRIPSLLRFTRPPKR